MNILQNHGDAVKMVHQLQAENEQLQTLTLELNRKLVLEEMSHKATKFAIVDALGGNVEGYPTQTINYLLTARRMRDVVASILDWWDEIPNDTRDLLGNPLCVTLAQIICEGDESQEMRKAAHESRPALFASELSGRRCSSCGAVLSRECPICQKSWES